MTQPSYLDTNLSVKELKSLVPAAFSKKAAPSTSSKYKFVSTEGPIKLLQSLGFHAVEARQINLRDGDISFQKHCITFVNPDYVVKNTKGQVQEIIQVHVVNSHNGTCHLKLDISLYRLVCTNGMLGLGNNFANLDLKHMSFDPAELEGKMIKIIESIPALEKAVRQMKSKLITKELQKKLALEMVNSYYDKEKAEKVDLDKLLTPLRPEDKIPSVWNIFNIVQEKLINGGEFSINAGKKLRGYKNLDNQMALNESIFAAAEKFLAPVAA